MRENSFSQKSAYIPLVFDSIAFKLSDLGQMFWGSFLKLLTIVCWNCGPFLLSSLRLSSSSSVRFEVYLMLLRNFSALLTNFLSD